MPTTRFHPDFHAFRDWLTEVSEEYSPSTANVYSSTLNVFWRALEKPTFAEATAADLQRALDAIPVYRRANVVCAFRAYRKFLYTEGRPLLPDIHAGEPSRTHSTLSCFQPSQNLEWALEQAAQRPEGKRVEWSLLYHLPGLRWSMLPGGDATIIKAAQKEIPGYVNLPNPLGMGGDGPTFIGVHGLVLFACAAWALDPVSKTIARAQPLVPRVQGGNDPATYQELRAAVKRAQARAGGGKR